MKLFVIIVQLNVSFLFKITIDLEISGIQAEQKETVRTGWIVEHNSNVARLVTLYVRKRK
jgi:hypothetical protein